MKAPRPWEGPRRDTREASIARVLMGMQPRDGVHRHKARCGRCGARCWLGERQRGLLAESEGDARVVCLSCVQFDLHLGKPTALIHLGNPEMDAGGKWKAGEPLVLVQMEAEVGESDHTV